MKNPSFPLATHEGKIQVDLSLALDACQVEEVKAILRENREAILQDTAWEWSDAACLALDAETGLPAPRIEFTGQEGRFHALYLIDPGPLLPCNRKCPEHREFWKGHQGQLICSICHPQPKKKH